MTNSSIDRTKKWETDFAAIRVDIQALSVRAQIFTRLEVDILEHNGDTAGGGLDGFLRPMYAESQLVCVRRLVDRDRRSISMVSILDEMIRFPEELSRERHAALLSATWVAANFGGTAKDADALFDDLAGPRSRHVPTSVLVELQDRIEKDAHDVRRHVNTVVAHRDRRPRSTTWGGLWRAIDDLGAAYERLGLLLLGLTPTWKVHITDQWTSAFRELFVTSSRG